MGNADGSVQCTHCRLQNLKRQKELYQPWLYDSKRNFNVGTLWQISSIVAYPIQNDTGQVIKLKQRMVGIHARQTHRWGVDNTFVWHYACRLMCVHYFDPFSNQNRSPNRKRSGQCGEDILVCHRNNRLQQHSSIYEVKLSKRISSSFFVQHTLPSMPLTQ